MPDCYPWAESFLMKGSIVSGCHRAYTMIRNWRPYSCELINASTRTRRYWSGKLVGGQQWECSSVGMANRGRNPNVARQVGKSSKLLATTAADTICLPGIDGVSLPLVCGLTRSHLIRSFSNEYGLPPHAYTNQLRLLAAKQLIAAGKKPAHAAAAVGLYDQSHLARLFGRAYGLTPGAYRKLRAPFERKCDRTVIPQSQRQSS